MPQQPSRPPSPLDLARVRPRPARPSAADFAALSGDEFFAALKQAWRDDVASPALIADCERRITSREAGPRELHQVLFAVGDRDAWAEARTLALAAAGQVPGAAVAVVGLEAQRLGVAPMRVTESAADGGFTATASLERDGARVEGKTGYGGSKKTARQAAAMSLLVALTGLAAPADGGTPAAASDLEDDPGLSPADLESWLDYEVARPSPDPELAVAVRPGKLTARSVYLLLFEADPRGWSGARAAAWEALVAAPTMAGGVLSMYSQARGWPAADYIETGEGSALAFLSAPDGPVVGAPGRAATAKAARAGAALALLRDLAPPAWSQARDAERTVADRSPVTILNERAQTGVISDLSYSHDVSGPPHAPVFTCTASCAHATGSHTCAAEGRTKNEAKTAAAAGLLDQITEHDQAAAARLARAAEAEARSAPGIFGRLLRAGCALDFRDRRFEVTGPAGAALDGPLADLVVPLLAALPVLARLGDPAADDGMTDEGAALPHESAVTWVRAARSALEAIAARRVYPALDAAGRDCWRIAGLAAGDGFADAVAEALLRTPGARLVIGDLPYAGRARVLDDGAAEWADRCAEAADPTPAAPMSLRVQPPAAAGSPLTAELHAPRLGHPEHRAARRAARDWPPLRRIRRDGTLGGEDAAELLGPAGKRLATHGIKVEWPADLVRGLEASAVARPRSAGGAFSLAVFTDLAWQLALDGEPLREAEADVVAAADGVARLRGRWVLIDPDTARRARERHLGQLTGVQALSAALTGQITVDGRDVPCAGAGGIADLVAALRDAGNAAGDLVDVPGGLRATLRGYQLRALRWLARTTELGFGALLADDMGLGKTLMVIAFHLHRACPGSARPGSAAGPTLVVCPASLLANWEREFARFAPAVRVRRYHAASRSLDGLTPPEGQVVVTTYGTLLRDASRLAEVGWGIVVADEAQQVKNHRSQAAQALRSLPAGARIAVTGTPVENSLSELWAILDWTNPGLFGTLATFRERYGRAAEREVGGDAARRLGRLVSPFLMRRRKTDPDVAPELPEKVVSDRYVELTREQAALYEAVTADTLARISASTGIARRGQVLRLLQSLRQICNSPAHFLREPADRWDAAAQAARSGKLQALEELMDSVAAAGDAALIFTGYVSMGHLIQAHLRERGMPAKFLHGGVPAAKRQEIVDEFASGGGIALIGSVRAAGTGLNLTRAGHVIHFDRPWNPAVEDQATDRAHRIGQHRTVNVHHLIAEGTVEDRIAELLARKRGLTEAVLAGGETALTELDDGELRALVSLGKGMGDAA
jgi:superfamily II DNA or RNA helicase